MIQITHAHMMENIVASSKFHDAELNLMNINFL